MWRSSALLVAGVALLGVSSARGDTFFNLRATANTATASSGLGPPLLQVNTIQGSANGGASFVNQYTTAAFPVVGDRVRSVAATPVTGYTVVPPGATTGSDGAPAGQKYTMVFIGDASITAAGVGQSTVTFTQNNGKLYLFESTGLFVPNDPSTWGIGANPVASWNIAAPNDITPGNAFSNPNSFLASQVNSFTANAGAGQQAQGRVLFNDLNDPFLPVTDSLPAGFTQVYEGLWGNVQETVADPNVFPFGGIGGANAAAALGALNALAGLAGLSDLGGANTGFATGLGAGTTTFNPSANFSTGDISFTLGASFSPGILGRPEQIEIPEPATLSLLGLAGAFGLVCRRVRRKRNG